MRFHLFDMNDVACLFFPAPVDLAPQVGPSKMADMWPKFEEKMKKEIPHHV